MTSIEVGLGLEAGAFNPLGCILTSSFAVRLFSLLNSFFAPNIVEIFSISEFFLLDATTSFY